MTPFLHEPFISFSPSLAATLGLEEAVLLSTLHQAREWMGWHEVSTVFQAQLEHALPFWTPQDIQRISQNLVAQGVLALHSAPYTQSLRLEFSLPGAVSPHSANRTSVNNPQTADRSQAASKLRKHPATPLSQSPVTASAQSGAQAMSEHWQPSRDVIAQLAQHQIPFEFMQEQVRDFVLYWRERGEVSHAWGSRFVKQVLRNWQHHRAQQGFEPQAQTPHAMHRAWQPSADALTILRAAGIDEEFSADAIPEFILYWSENGKVLNTWNSLFVKHVKRQWASYRHALRYDTEPRPISKDWQPSEDAMEVLTLANIDLEFARSEIPSFVLFWLETRQAYSSWNSKYIQHVKYQWARRHQLNSDYADERHRDPARAGTTKDPDFIRRHSDTSWAEGI